MSRIGKLPVALPSGVNVTLARTKCTSRAQGRASPAHSRAGVVVKIEDGNVLVERKATGNRSARLTV